MPFRIGLLDEPVKQVSGLARGVVGYAGMVCEGCLLEGSGSPSYTESSAGVRFIQSCLGRVILVQSRIGISGFFLLFF